MESRPKGGGSGGSSRPPAAPAEAASAGRTHQVKVMHIVTREVTTDEANFKDVVQRLTGKDSAAARAAAVAAVGSSSWSVDAVASGGAGASNEAVFFEDTVAGVMHAPVGGGHERLWRGA